MKCLLKTIIAIVLIVVIGGLLLWFVGFPALLAEDKAVKNLEKQDYEVQTFNSDDLLGAVGLFMPEGAKTLVSASKGDLGDDRDSISIYYFDETKDAKNAKESLEKEFNESIDALIEQLTPDEDSTLNDMMSSVTSDMIANLEQTRKDTKFVRFGKIFVVGSVRGIVTAMTGF